MPLVLRKYFVDGPFDFVAGDQQWTDIESFVSGLEVDLGAAETAITAINVILDASNTPQFANVRLTGLVTGHILAANSAGGLTGINMVTKGGILIGDGSGAPRVLAVGSNGQALVADSAQTTGVKWDSVGATGLVVLSNTNITSPVAAVDFSSSLITSAYDEYEIHLRNLIPVADDSFKMQLSRNNGSTWDANNYGSGVIRATSTTVTGLNHVAESTIPISGNSDVGSDALEFGLSGVIRVYGAADAAKYTDILSQVGFANGSTYNCSYNAAFQSRGAGVGAVNALRFSFASQNIESGSITLYGVKKS